MSEFLVDDVSLYCCFLNEYFVYWISMTKKYLNDLTYRILGCCINVHKELGPGLLESVYHRCLVEEFKHNGIEFFSELIVPVSYRDVELDTHLRADFLIEKSIVVELKAVDGLLPIHEAQILTYMKLLEVPKGILINFNSINIYDYGQRTFVNELFRELKDS